MVDPPGSSQVPLCPILCKNIEYKLFGIFRETLFFGFFQNFYKQENDDGTMENVSKTKPTEVLRHFTMHIPSENGGKRGENIIWDSENVSKRVNAR